MDNEQYIEDIIERSKDDYRSLWIVGSEIRNVITIFQKHIAVLTEALKEIEVAGKCTCKSEPHLSPAGHPTGASVHDLGCHWWFAKRASKALGEKL